MIEARADYKKSTAGYIPQDWQDSTIGECVNFSGGTQPPRTTFTFSPSTENIRLVQIRDYKSNDFATYIPKALARKFCSEDDIMIGRYGPPVFQILRGIEGAYNVALIKATNLQSIDREYLYYVLTQPSLFHLIDSLSRRTSGQTGVEMPALRAFPLPLPPLPEQKAIAKALGDVDGLIASLEALIVKKRDIKQGAMQELLSGHRRLPGFKDAWVVLRIKDFTSCTSGGTPSTSVSSYWDGNVPWMSSGELHSRNVWEVAVNISKLGLENSSAKLLPSGCVLIGLAGQGKTRGTVAINRIPLTTNQSIGAVLPNNSFSSEYLYYNLLARYDELRELSSGDGGRGGLNLRIIGSLEIPLPAVEEQKKIAEVLDGMDAEIAALEAKLAKTCDVKQGMMQVLLTGEVRLV